MDVPSLKLHKGTGQGCVWWKGKAKYFGKYGEPATDRAYWRWRESLGTSANGGRTLGELLNLYERKKTLDRVRKSRLNNIRDALASISGLEANSYSPSMFREHRAMVAGTGTRTARQVNDLMRFMRQIVKWGAGNNIVKPEVWQALGIIEPLETHEVEKQSVERKPVLAEHVIATLPFLSDRAWAMVRLLMLTGGRPSEVVGMRKDELRCNGPLGTWFSELKSHKNSKRKKRRFLVFKKEAQDILTAMIAISGDSPWVFPSEVKPGEHYAESSLRQAVGHACKPAGVLHWTPYQIRHLVGTDIATDQGLQEAARILGHHSVATTLIYAHQPDAEQIRNAG